MWASEYCRHYSTLTISYLYQDLDLASACQKRIPTVSLGSKLPTGMYLNLGNDGFRAVRKSTYVDKTGLITYVNSVMGTKEKLICVSRPRRFGKSFAAQMLCAYYDRSCDSRALFEDLEIGRDPSFEEHLNQYDVIYLDITLFIALCGDIKRIVPYIQEQVAREQICCYY